MKKLIFVATVLTLVAFAFGALAQQKGTPPPAQPAQVVQTWNAAVGVIEKIDAAAKTLEVKTMVKVDPKKPAQEKMMTFATDDKTKIFILGEKRQEKKLSFADLKTGMTVWIIYKVETGKNMATSIEVR